MDKVIERLGEEVVSPGKIKPMEEMLRLSFDPHRMDDSSSRDYKHFRLSENSGTSYWTER